MRPQISQQEATYLAEMLKHQAEPLRTERKQIEELQREITVLIHKLKIGWMGTYEKVAMVEVDILAASLEIRAELSEENVHTVIVYGIVTSDEQEEMLIGSLRTSKITIDPDQFIKETFGRDEVGHFFGGGKPMAGGFEIPIGFLAGDSTEEFRDLKWQVYDQQIKQKIFAKIGIESE